MRAAPGQFDEGAQMVDASRLLAQLAEAKALGVIDGRNIWRTDVLWLALRESTYPVR